MVNWNPAWANAIANIESRGSGGYSAVGPKTKKGNRAYGKYQVMDFNIPSWTKKHLGKSLTPAEFLANPEAQDAVFRGEFGSSVAKYGNPQDAASVWFTGKPLKVGANRTDILGTSGQGYVNKFNKELGGSKMAQANPNMQTNPNILSQLFGSGNSSQPFAAPEPQGILERFGLQKMVEGAEGQTGQRFYNRDNFLDLVSRFGAVASENPVAQQMALDGINRRADRRQSNKTAEYLNSIGQTDLANAIGQGLISGPEAMDRLFGLSDAERQAKLEQYRYDRGLADQRLDTQTGYDREDEVARREREQALQDLVTNQDFQREMASLRTANQKELAEYKENLLRTRPRTEYERIQQNIALEQIKLAEDRLAEQASVNDANIAQTEATTEQIQLENQKLENEVEKLNNPPAPNSEVAQAVFGDGEGQLEDINIRDVARLDPFGFGERAWNSFTTFFGAKGVGVDEDKANLNVLNNMIKSGLAKTLTDRGSVTELEELNKITFSVNQTNAQMAGNMRALIPLLRQTYEVSFQQDAAGIGTANQKAKNKNIINRYPDIIASLERSLAEYDAGDTVAPQLDEDGIAVMDEADKIIRNLSGAGQ